MFLVHLNVSAHEDLKDKEIFFATVSVFIILNIQVTVINLNFIKENV